ncbi:MAG: hypothetical protein EB136_10650, partial [Synechococcaceae bacterium WBB_3_034]|nr:hypothetical protein [Synechococcaceae bacterium WBB_3_034]
AQARAAGAEGPWLLRHQADWLMGWLLADWRWGEEGNNLRLGWDLRAQAWCRNSQGPSAPAARAWASSCRARARLPLALAAEACAPAGPTRAAAAGAWSGQARW